MFTQASVCHLISALLCGRRGLSLKNNNKWKRWCTCFQNRTENTLLCPLFLHPRTKRCYVSVLSSASKVSKSSDLMLELWGPSVQLLFRTDAQDTSTNAFSMDKSVFRTLISPVATQGLMVHRHLEINLMPLHSSTKVCGFLVLELDESYKRWGEIQDQKTKPFSRSSSWGQKSWTVNFSKWLRCVVSGFTGIASKEVKGTSEASYEQLMFIWQNLRKSGNSRAVEEKRCRLAYLERDHGMSSLC